MTGAHVPPLGFRVAVVVGGAALLAGIAASVSLAVRGETYQPVLGPGALPRVLLADVPDGAVPAVRVRWEQDGMTVLVPASRADGHPDLWLLPPAAPPRGEVTVIVEDVSVTPAKRLAEAALDMAEARQVTLRLGAGPPPD